MSHLGVVTKVGQARLLEHGKQLTGFTLKLMLIKANFTPSEDTAIGDLTEADYGGYGRQDVTLGDVSEGDDGKVQVFGTEAVFTFESVVTPQDLYGWALVCDEDDGIVAVRKWPDAPREKDDASPAYSLIVRIRLSNEVHVEE